VHRHGNVALTAPNLTRTPATTHRKEVSHMDIEITDIEEIKCTDWWPPN
jgi:hypothetical protein